MKEQPYRVSWFPSFIKIESNQPQKRQQQQGFMLRLSTGPTFTHVNNEEFWIKSLDKKYVRGQPPRSN